MPTAATNVNTQTNAMKDFGLDLAHKQTTFTFDNGLFCSHTDW